MENKKLRYEDPRVNVKLLLSALWTSVMFLYIYGDYFELYVPGKVEDLLHGSSLLNTPYKLLIASIIMVLPTLMIFLPLLIRPSHTRILSIIIGIFLTLFTLLVGLSSIAEWKIFYVILSFLESYITAMIVWKAWRWPRN